MDIRINDNPIEALSCNILQKEGEVAKAIVRVAQTDNIPQGALTIQIRQQRLFEGLIVSMFKENENISQIHAHMTFDDVLVNCVNLTPQPDKCFGDPNHPSDRLEGLPYIFHFNRANRAIELSHIIRGNKHWIAQNIIKIAAKKRPSFAIEVALKACWMIRKQSVFDVAASIKTLTGNHLQRSWHAAIQSSGYKIIDSSLKTIKEYPIGPFEKNMYLTARECDASLTLLATEEKRIEERVTFTIGKGACTKKLELTVPHLDEYNAFQFFSTELGKSWIEHAMLYGRNHFYALNRSHLVSICAPFTPDLFDISLDHMITIDGFGCGKLYAYTIEDGRLAHLDVRIYEGGEPSIPPAHVPEEQDTSATPFIQGLHIDNSLDDQITYVKQHMQEVLETRYIPATRLFLELRDLKSNKCVKRSFSLP